jgi:hypothetical protein
MANTPTAGLANVTSVTPGTPVNALDIALVGGYIFNPANAPGPLNIDPTGPASLAANGTTMALPPGSAFYAITDSTMFVSVCSQYPSHAFVSVQWKLEP